MTRPGHGAASLGPWLLGPLLFAHGRVHLMWLVPTEWWGSLVVGAAGLSTVTLAVLFSPMLLLGFAINAGLVWFVSASAWTP